MRIRSSIEQARLQESQSSTLKAYVQEKLPALHHAIKLPEENAEDVLIDFLTRYIEHVPDFLDALIELAKAAGIYDFVKQFVEIAQSYFIVPPEAISDHEGFLALIDESYLAHRLMEEVNDRIMVRCGAPLTPMDMTLSNLVVHQLLGEEFANKLDMAVHYSMETLFDNETVLKNPAFASFITLHRSGDWDETLETWPCLAGDSSIELQLGQTANVELFH